MDNCYKSFVEVLREKLLELTELDEEQIYFKDKDTYPCTSGDRMIVVCYELEDCKEVCALHVRELFHHFLNGRSIDEITESVIEELKKVSHVVLIDKIKQLKNYEKIKNDLFIRLLNVERNREELKRAVYRVIGDVALVLYMKMSEQEGVTTSMKIREDMMEAWGRDKKTVFEAALWNTYVMSPPRMYSWEKMMFEEDYCGEEFMDFMSGYELNRETMGNCLSTAKKTNGAVSIFLPGVARRLAEMMGESFYVVFTSIHEVMIHNEKFAEPERLRRVLRDTICETTPEDDILSMKIFHYNKETGIFSFV